MDAVGGWLHLVAGTTESDAPPVASLVLMGLFLGWVWFKSKL